MSGNELTKRLKAVDWKSPIFSAIIAMVVLMIFFSIMNPKFLYPRNIVTIFLNASIIGIMTSGMTMVIISGNIDLSCTGSAAIAVMMIGFFYEKGLPLWPALIVGLTCSALAGLFNGFLVAKVKLNSLIVTVANMMVFRAIAYMPTNTRSVLIQDKNFSIFGRYSVFGNIPISVFYMLIFFIVMGYVLGHTAFGRRVYAIGGNLQASYYNGINIEKTQMQIFTLMGIISGVGGIVAASQTMAFVSNTLINREFDFISPCIIGGVAMSGGKGKMVGAFIGCIFLAIVSNGMVLLNIQSYWQNFVKGAILIYAMCFDAIRNRESLA
jgi:ribose/xylose/arabinose/galactoside ABC-type transport system permease subunit